MNIESENINSHNRLVTGSIPVEPTTEFRIAVASWTYSILKVKEIHVPRLGRFYIGQSFNGLLHIFAVLLESLPTELCETYCGMRLFIQEFFLN